MKNGLITCLLAVLFCLPLAFGFPFVTLTAVSVLLTFTYVRNSLKLYLICLAVCLICLAAVFWSDLPAALCCFMPVAAVSYLLGSGIKKKKSFANVIISSSVAAIAAITVILLYLSHVTGKTPFSVIFGDYIAILKQVFAQLELSADLADSFALQLEYLFPSFIIIFASVEVYIVFGISRYVLERKGYVPENMPYFYQLRLGKTFATVFLVILLFSLFGGASIVSMNIIAVAITLFSVCGISVCVYWLRNAGLPKAVRIIIYVLFAMLVLLSVLGGLPMIALFGIGIFDCYRPLRIKRED